MRQSFYRMCQVSLIFVNSKKKQCEARGGVPRIFLIFKMSIITHAPTILMYASSHSPILSFSNFYVHVYAFLCFFPTTYCCGSPFLTAVTGLTSMAGFPHFRPHRNDASYYYYCEWTPAQTKIHVSTDFDPFICSLFYKIMKILKIIFQ